MFLIQTIQSGKPSISTHGRGIIGKLFYLGAGKCPSRNVEAQRIYNYLIENGWTATEKADRADIIILSTCASKVRAAEASLEVLRKLYKKKSESSRFIVTGCLPWIESDAVKEFKDLHLLPPKELERIDDIFEHEIKMREIPEPNLIEVPDVTCQDALSKRIPYRFELSIPFIRFCYYRIAELLGRREAPRKYFDLKLGTGCLGSCTYCGIKFATGKMVSKDLEILISDFRRALVSGYRYINIVGQDTGAWGLDIGRTFKDLLYSLLRIEGDYRLTIQDFNAWWLNRYFEDLLHFLQIHRERIEEIRIPIQSGSDRILKLMKRPYRADEVSDKILQLRKALPAVRLQTHMMVGFPGETHRDFMLSAKLLEELKFDEVGVFIYEDRPNTEASAMDGKIPGRVAKRRANILSVKWRSINNRKKS